MFPFSQAHYCSLTHSFCNPSQSLQLSYIFPFPSQNSNHYVGEFRSWGFSNSYAYTSLKNWTTSLFLYTTWKQNSPCILMESWGPSPHQEFEDFFLIFLTTCLFKIKTPFLKSTSYILLPNYIIRNIFNEISIQLEYVYLIQTSWKWNRIKFI